MQKTGDREQFLTNRIPALRGNPNRDTCAVHTVLITITRSDMAWKAAFREAGLRLVKEQVQEGLPDGLYVVKM